MLPGKGASLHRISGRSDIVSPISSSDRGAAALWAHATRLIFERRRLHQLIIIVALGSA
jgi:hypothetical protein